LQLLAEMEITTSIQLHGEWLPKKIHRIGSGFLSS
jgi:hypothetical protein